MTVSPFEKSMPATIDVSDGENQTRTAENDGENHTRRAGIDIENSTSRAESDEDADIPKKIMKGNLKMEL